MLESEREHAKSDTNLYLNFTFSAVFITRSICIAKFINVLPLPPSLSLYFLRFLFCPFSIVLLSLSFSLLISTISYINILESLLATVRASSFRRIQLRYGRLDALEVIKSISYRYCHILRKEQRFGTKLSRIRLIITHCIFTSHSTLLLSCMVIISSIFLQILLFLFLFS